METPLDVAHCHLLPIKAFLAPARVTSFFWDVSMLEATVKKILQARVYEAACETPISPAPFLSRRFNNQILIKREDLQPVFRSKFVVPTTKWPS
ncbi:hypothetical protein DK37_09850 [Halomonas sp. SUBG004]|nr:hypothetical protein DK37_09850 [Halomonas sp. SUBG004]